MVRDAYLIKRVFVDVGKVGRDTFRKVGPFVFGLFKEILEDAMGVAEGV